MNQSDTPARPPLNGWKEIAAYLGKSVRAVQRWEQVGLPVHRIKTAEGQSVYAYADEIDAWRRASDQPETEPPPVVPASPRARLPWIAFAVLAVACVAVPTIYFMRATPAVRFELRGGALEAFTDGSELAWRYVFDQPVGQLQHDGGPVVAESDLDGDGVAEILVKVHLLAAQGKREHEALFCFDRRGSMRWKYEPQLSVTFDGRRFEGPWRLYEVFLSPRDRHVWLSFGHHTWWPSALVRIDARGDASVRYIQSGAIYAVAHLEMARGPYVVAGGVNNEYGAASMALLPANETGPARVSPQTPGRGYHCDDCNGAGPEAFVLFPRSELNLVSGEPYNRVNDLRTAGETLVLETHEFGRAGAVFELDHQLRLRSADVTDGYVGEHRRLHGMEKLAHGVEHCVRWPGPAQVRRWTAQDGWREEPLPVADAHR